MVYYNPRNIDFKTPIKEIVQTKLKNKDDIFFLQEFVDNIYVNVQELFPNGEYMIHGNDDFKKVRSNVVAITLKNSNWEVSVFDQGNDKNFPNTNKIISMENKNIKLCNKNLQITSFQNTDKDIENSIKECCMGDDIDIIIGDFNNSIWIAELKDNKSFRDLVTDDMITFKPAQTTIDRIFVRNRTEFDNKIVFNGVVETYASDHNLLSFCLNI
ncbi:MULTISPECIES: hypothetical protein [Clostridium]|uniref:Endonuclease/exonuclease/phosphatase family protein n=2 Tax=Clostridium TaxID=1485 RepID=A0AAV3W329_9CLOT|nr:MULTISPECIES: hypothetical protein [Clostridium]AYK27061.1 endonuclease/exonuclease/phosphatase family protein [Clostridium beijerinckii NRRL B-598]MBC2477982.1 endonuclease/exonuclease/phosphatase family protein [Clostridium beijerinckii]MDG5856514.1 endonuclease/exonuclease/phosphatase family protein [Clostridium beijerinckii]NOV59777.1 hypothetical protein [Clostridium beijerinckii]NOV71439.1 hypothetical protein [Clostridium beijerinckii]